MQPPKKTKRAGQPLSPREHEVLLLVTEGLSNKQIADQMSLSAHTVKFHLRNAGEKIGTTSRTKAAVIFVKARPWIGGFAAALAEVHRHGGGRDGHDASRVICNAARNAGLTLAGARDAGVSAVDLEELQRAKMP